jgi:long-chain fatty acid transport protein
MIIQKRNLVLAAAVAVAVAAPAAFATNGMNMQGYGPIAYGMGGASMAYDNGMAATMNNPATLALMPQGNRLDLALGYLGPVVESEGTKSDATAFWMPAVGFGHKDGPLTVGIGMFAQGGMGAEYDKNSTAAAGSGDKVRSELGVGRLIFPVAYEVDSNLKIGGSVDYVWGTMDILMALSGGQFLDMAAGFPGATTTMGTMSGSMLTTFGGMVFGGVVNPANPLNWGRFEFADDNQFSGAAKGAGLAGKIGAVYKVNNQLSIGGAYHSKTALGDMKDNSAKAVFNVNLDDAFGTGGFPAGTYTATTVEVKGKVAVKDFQWPDQIAIGMAYQATDALLVVADYKRIGWKAAMKDFNMVFTADPAAAQAGLAQGFGGTVLDATLYQDWDDQNVYQIGAAYKVTDAVTVRAGYNYASNPIPEKFVQPLFPAIMESHYTLGAGFTLSKTSTFDVGAAIAPQVKATNDDPTGGQTSKAGGNSFQIMYSNRF